MVGSGHVKVNGKPTRLDYKFKDNDFLESVVHRLVLSCLETYLHDTNVRYIFIFGFFMDF